MALFSTLILAHLIADFPLQTDSVFRLKNRSALGIWLHVLIHVVVTGLLVRPITSSLIMLVAIGVLHFCCDWFKIHFTSQNCAWSFLGDQLLHVVILFFCARFFTDVNTVFSLSLVFPALAYAAIPSLTVFLFVLGHDLASRDIQQPQLVAWSMVNGLKVSHYFSGPLVIMLLWAFLL